MNWTGGQLRRHSARPGVLSKSQRQNFAKFRQLTSRRASAQPTPFGKVPDRFSKDGTGELAEANHFRATGPGKPRSANSLPNDRLGALKRRLLQQPDWAAVSAARPLEIEFPSMEEVGQVAKRRKLTDLDRKRLSAHGDLTIPEMYRRRLPFSESFGLGHVTIRIDGRLAGSPSDDTQALPTKNPSSYSMLLDSEPPASFQVDVPRLSPVFPWKVSPGRLSLQPSHNRAPLRLEEQDIPINTHMVEGFNPTNYTPLRNVASKFNLANSSPYCFQVGTNKGTSIVNFSGNTAGSPLPRHRFTIDDQLLQEQMRLNTTLDSPQYSRPICSCSLRQTSSPLPTLVMADASFEPMASSWLLQPKRISQSSSPLNSRSPFNNQTKLFQSTVNEMPCSGFSSPSLVTENPACLVSMKIFGQVVQL